MASMIWLIFCAVSPERERGDLAGLGVGTVAVGVSESAVGVAAVVGELAAGEMVAGVGELMISAVLPNS